METKAIQAYQERANGVVVHAGSICIVGDTTRELAVEFTANVRKAIKAIEKEFRPDIDTAHQLHKDLLARLNKLTAPFKEARHIVDKEIGRDYLEQAKIQREKERVAQAKVDEEKRRQEVQLAKEAEECIADGDMEGAEALLDSEVVVNPDVPVADVQQTVRTVSGSSTVRKDIKVEVVCVNTVLAAILDKKLPSAFVSIDLGVAKRYAKANELTDLGMCGFRITETVVVAGRTQ